MVDESIDIPYILWDCKYRTVMVVIFRTWCAIMLMGIILPSRDVFFFILRLVKAGSQDYLFTFIQVIISWG